MNSSSIKFLTNLIRTISTGTIVRSFLSGNIITANET